MLIVIMNTFKTDEYDMKNVTNVIMITSFVALYVVGTSLPMDDDVASP